MSAMTGSIRFHYHRWRSGLVGGDVRRVAAGTIIDNDGPAPAVGDANDWYSAHENWPLFSGYKVVGWQDVTDEQALSKVYVIPARGSITITDLHADLGIDDGNYAATVIAGRPVGPSP